MSKLLFLLLLLLLLLLISLSLLIHFKLTNLQTIPYKNMQHKIAKQGG